MSELFSNLLQAGMSLSSHDIWFSAAAVFAAAILRGLTGFGFSLAVVPLLGLSMAPAKAVPIAIAVQLLGSLLDFRSASRACHWPSLRWLTLGAVIGSPIGALLLSRVPANASGLTISLITLLAVALLGCGFTLPNIPSRIPTSIVGAISGVFNGLAAMPGPAVVAYYMATPLTAATTRASLMMFFLFTSIAALASALAVDLMTLQTMVLAVILLPVMWVGTTLGTLGFAKTSAPFHRMISMGSLAAIGLASGTKFLLASL